MLKDADSVFSIHPQTNRPASCEYNIKDADSALSPFYHKLTTSYMNLMFKDADSTTPFPFSHKLTPSYMNLMFKDAGSALSILPQNWPLPIWI
jgi:hypothetical protein